MNDLHVILNDLATIERQATTLLHDRQVLMDYLNDVIAYAGVIDDALLLKKCEQTLTRLLANHEE